VTNRKILVLTRTDVRRFLTLEDCITAVERAFHLNGQGKIPTPGVLGMHSSAGGFHVKTGILPLTRNYFAAKVNSNFPENRVRFGSPTIQGVIVLCNADNGEPLAVMDSMEITSLRTAAATAVAAKHLARQDSRVATVCGCGEQGRVQLNALAKVLSIQHVFAFDVDDVRAREFANQLSPTLGVAIEVIQDLGWAVDSDVWISCTTSRHPFLQKEHIRPGAFVAAVGADNPEKQEMHPELMASAKIVVDSIEQCAKIGDLHHALESGLLVLSDVYGELGEVVAKRKPGRTSMEETILFDSTGVAFADVAAAALVYEKAQQAGFERVLELAA